MLVIDDFPICPDSADVGGPGIGKVPSTGHIRYNLVFPSKYWAGNKRFSFRE